ncbi:hypothetical protein ACFUMH_13645 [Cellulomonas sp. NPDC057328]|uniref:hypothetical protein n=1 Tax=Cellulomonas sp. NPDC057328 TaxID=3346101 RepID=UPI00363DAA0E
MSGRAARLLARAVLVLGTLVALAAAGGGAPPAQAADLSRFDPGMIISDQNFWDSGVMTTAEVQAFLDARGTGCRPGPDGTPCLKDARFDTETRAADTRCTATYPGAAQESAAQVITKVAAACGVSPRVLLVMLQKEQGLVTASGANLTPSRYRAAMGYGCPDTAACDARYYGFVNQVYQASRQLRNYALNPNGYAHRAGVVNQVRFHPNAACGSAPVLIRNQATAGLYNYTPYQPNRAALAAGYGTGDTCSSYGNRNFFSYYSDWFGDPAGRAPIGYVDSFTTTSRGFTVSGWSLDPDSRESNQVHVYVDGVGYATVADLSRPDVDAAYGMGDRRGFRLTLDVPPGPHRVCTYGVNIGPGDSTLFECRDITIVDAVPVGAAAIATGMGTITVSGWAHDPDTPDPIAVHVYVGGVGTAVVADRTSPPGTGVPGAHGFALTTAAPEGTHRVCAYAINTSLGAHTTLRCQDVAVRTHAAPPVGAIDEITVRGRTLTVGGWALDPDTSSPIGVHVYVDGVGAAVVADAPRPDVGAAYGRSGRHGYVHQRELAPGVRTVCVYAINDGAGPNTTLGCSSVTVTAGTTAPRGAIDEISVDGRTLTVRGWALDPDTTASIGVHVYVDGVGTALVAAAPRPDVAAAFGRRTDHGYTHQRTLAPGAHTVCVYAINDGPGANTTLGCAGVTVSAGTAAPFGAVDEISVSGRTLTVRGWALDPDTSAAIAVHVYVDGVGTSVLADRHRADVHAAYRMGPDHGYMHQAAVTAGRRTVCVYAINDAPGPNTTLGCATVTVG